MLFTSPMFAFLFLPASVLLYLAFGKHRKRGFIFWICVSFHLLLNLHHPLGLLFVPAVVLYSWLGGMAIVRYRKSWFIFSVCVIPYLCLILFRNLLFPMEGGFWYPVGMTVAAMRSTSYFLEAVRGEIKRRNRLFDLSLYMLFFPTMIVGPFVKYSDFLRLTEEDRITPDVRNLSDGALLFAEGFIKRIALGAVLIDALGDIAERFRGTPDLLMGLFLLILVYFGIYFSVTGYADMGCGIARMLGIRLRHVPTSPFRAVLPDEYTRSLFPSLSEWLDDYVVRPLTRIWGGRFPHLIHGLAYGGCLLLIVRPSLYILLLAVPSVGIEYLCSRFRLKERLKGRMGPAALCTVLTVSVVSVGWLVVVMGDVESVWKYMSHMTYEYSEYYTDLVLVSFSGIKYLSLFAIAAILLLPGFGMERFLHRRSPRTQTVLESVYMIAVLLLFLFTIFFFLPQYGTYSTVPFRYVYI